MASSVMISENKQVNIEKIITTVLVSAVALDLYCVITEHINIQGIQKLRCNDAFSDQKLTWLLNECFQNEILMSVSEDGQQSFHHC